jgi:dipeptidyl aminopeptidase/acylaminoacyl peptidase
MTISLLRCAGAAILCAASAIVAAAPQPIERFARRPQMYGVTISADGRYVAFLSGAEDDTVLMTFDRTTGSEFKRVTGSEPNKFDLGWCRWANDKRLLCGLYGNIRGKKYAEAPFRRLFAVDADGGSLKVLEGPRNDANLFVQTTSMRNFNANQGQNVERAAASETARGVGAYTSLAAANFVRVFNPGRQDELIDITPDDRDTVLIQVDDDHDSYPTLFNLNIYTGARTVRAPENLHIQSYVSDGRGNPRIAQGTSKTLETNYYARLEGELGWHPLVAIQSNDATVSLRPIAMAATSNVAYALGVHEGRDALWTIDLTDKRPPQLLFQHPLVDVGEPILQTDQSLIGVRYDVERPYAWYANPKMRELIDKLDAERPGRHEIVDMSQDQKVLVIRSSSDTDEGSYAIYNAVENRLQKLGTAYPDLPQNALGKMTNILYKASDGTEIPGYLTVPSDGSRKNLPLIVMPHDGPQARDTWKFSFLRTFLANRGYAVLQMNYRGSSGLGEKWRVEADQDWAGLTYSDIQDATRWAISEGIADPKRICILGTGFGGYEALLSAARNTGTYRCAASIAGIADPEMQRQFLMATGNTAGRKEIGSDREKLERDSPLKNAQKINIPVLLVHGTKDWQVQMDHTIEMSDRLDEFEKPNTTVIIKGANHDFERKSERIALLKAVEDFLAQNLTASASP